MSDARTPVIRVRNLRKSFGHLEVLKSIDMEVYPGEVVVIIGPSGSGKSTLLRTFNQLESIDGGEILFDGEIVGYEVEKGVLRRRKAASILAQRR